ncbi:MAG: hypothetical protein JXA77_08655 [Bacteroidales bacterium]|nr:hypothetical protein [Bacteroidales bacterium]MBN2817576.1 hypothetical protein [Bacteroidales bacterium]
MAKYISLKSIGLIGEDKQKGIFRQVVFQDKETGLNTDYIVFKKERPFLWADIEKMEKGKTLPPYRGSIERYNTIHIVVFEDELVEQAFEKQKWKLKLKSKLNFVEADKMRLETKGYRTNLTSEKAMEISWHEIDKKAELIKFRLYKGKGEFKWTDWYEITQK